LDNGKEIIKREGGIPEPHSQRLQHKQTN